MDKFIFLSWTYVVIELAFFKIYAMIVSATEE